MSADSPGHLPEETFQLVQHSIGLTHLVSGAHGEVQPGGEALEYSFGQQGVIREFAWRLKEQAQQ